VTKAFAWVLLWFAATLVSTSCAGTKNNYRYYFANDRLPEGYIRVSPDTKYAESRGYGWWGEETNHFAIHLPEGNYNVSVAYESPEAAASATVKAEARRLMLKAERKVESAERKFTVNIRRPEIEGSDLVALNTRETEPTMIAHWDEMLTLEFLPGISGLTAIKIEPVADAVTVFIAGDSTVTDQRSEPWAGWGQLLPSLFAPGVAIANHAESGRALFSFLEEKRLDKILSVIKPGDYLLIQFGHNDQKDKRQGAGPFTTYKQELEEYINRARVKRAIPVLVTSMERRRWSEGKPQETLTDYAKAMHQVGQILSVPVIDLHAMSLKLYAAMGENGSQKAFVHYPANTFPGQDKALKDNTHHNTYGAYELARCVAEGIRSEVPDLARYLRSDMGAFDPSNPEEPGSLKIPASSDTGSKKPEGN